MILLTGGTGILGHEYISQSRPQNILALARQPENLPQGVTPLQGDLSAPGLGLQTFDNLQNIETVIHMAANTKWNLSDEDALHVNSVATQQLVDVVKAHCPKIKHFIYVSTAFVDESSHPKEHPYLHRDNYNNSYEFSKAHAEEIVRTCGLPYSIVRPSIIIGRTTDGGIHRSSGIYQMFQLFFSGNLPAIIGYDDARLDVVPVDDVAQQIQNLAHQPATQTTHYISSGEKAPLLKEVLELLQSEVHQQDQLKNHIPPLPSFVKPDTFERFFLPMIKRNAHLPVRKYLKIIKYFQPYLAIRKSRQFETYQNLQGDYDMSALLRTCFQAWIFNNARQWLTSSDKLRAQQHSDRGQNHASSTQNMASQHISRAHMPIESDTSSLS